MCHPVFRVFSRIHTDNSQTAVVKNERTPRNKSEANTTAITSAKVAVFRLAPINKNVIPEMDAKDEMKVISAKSRPERDVDSKLGSESGEAIVPILHRSLSSLAVKPVISCSPDVNCACAWLA